MDFNLGIEILTEIEIFTSKLCPFCVRAKRLLESKGVLFKEIDVTFDIDARQKMSDMADSYSVPQIFVNGDHIGDCDQIYALEEEKKLDAKLGLCA